MKDDSYIQHGKGGTSFVGEDGTDFYRAAAL